MAVKLKSIKCTVTGFEFTPAKTICRGQEELQPQFADYIARCIHSDIVKAIETQSRRSKWKPLSPSYLSYKRRKGLSTKIWKSSGNMVSSIYKINRGNRILIGVTDKRKYPNSDITLREVAVYLEYGTPRMPARPLFRPIFSKYYKNMRGYWNKFLKDQSRTPK